MNQIPLRGCAPEPLIHYLKALGILRLVAEQLDPRARAAWDGDTFMLETEKTKDELLQFFLDEYEPTPLIAPWNNGSGFHADKDSSGTGKKVVNLRNIKNSTNARLNLYRETISLAEELLARCMTPEIKALPSIKRSEALKPTLIPLCRNNLDDKVVKWIDAVCFLASDDALGLPPLLGSAGNDGNQEFSLTFMGALDQTIATNNIPRSESRSQLRASILGETGAQGVVASPGQFNPSGTGGANATSGANAHKAENLSNPWDYVLAVEGALLFAGAAVRRLVAGAKVNVAYPFFVRSIDVDGSVSPDEEGRGDVFLPIWSRYASLQEMVQLFNEGRIRLGRKQPKDTIEFARAVASLGVDRGITRFHRHSLLTRNGNMQFASSLGSLEVPRRPKLNLLQDFDDWLNQFRRIAREKNSSKVLQSLVRQINEYSYRYCSGDEEQSREYLEALLITLGKAENQISIRAALQKDSKSRKALACIRLTKSWFYECRKNYGAQNIESFEYELAAAIASIKGLGVVGSIRENFEPVMITEKSIRWATAMKKKEKNTASAVWSLKPLEENLATILHRRSIDARSQSISHPPITGSRFASLKAVDAFLKRETDDARIEDLLGGLILINWANAEPFESKSETRVVPPTLSRAYVLLKLLFLPAGRFQPKPDAEPIIIKHEPSIIPLLRAGRIPDALDLAARRLMASGVMPLTTDFYLQEEEGVRLASALLIPIDEPSRRAIARLVLGDGSED
jgi:CRISPR-associated protein Csx17